VTAPSLEKLPVNQGLCVGEMNPKLELTSPITVNCSLICPAAVP
jgi:hypothetical protein